MKHVALYVGHLYKLSGAGGGIILGVFQGSLGGILGPLKSDLGVFWAKIPLYPYNVKTQKTHFLKIPLNPDFELLDS